MKVILDTVDLFLEEEFGVNVVNNKNYKDEINDKLTSMSRKRRKRVITSAFYLHSLIAELNVIIDKNQYNTLAYLRDIHLDVKSL